MFHSHSPFHSSLILQELNSKAESKFNKLKAQAKTKIANLNRELEKLRAEKGGGGGEVSFNVSTLVRKEHLSGAAIHIFTLYKFRLGGGGQAGEGQRCNSDV